MQRQRHSQGESKPTLLQEKDKEIRRLEQENRKHKLQIEKLEEKTRRDDTEALEANRLLAKQVAQLQQAVTQAEKQQHEAETDTFLYRCLEDSDDDGPCALDTLRAELDFAIRAQQQSARRTREMEEELDRSREAARSLSIQLQDSKFRRATEEREAQDGGQTLQAVKMANSEIAQELKRWKAVSTQREELAAALLTQVGMLTADNQSMRHAIVSCQRSAEKRLLVLERDRQAIQAENQTLRAELTNVQHALEGLDKKLCKVLEEDDEETLALESDLARCAAQAQEYKDQLADQTVRFQELERQLQELDMAAQKQQQLQKQLEVEKDKIQCQFELSPQVAEGGKLTQELEAVKNERDEFKAMATEWQTQWFNLTSVTLLQIERLKRSQQEFMRQHNDLDASDFQSQVAQTNTSTPQQQ